MPSKKQIADGFFKALDRFFNAIGDGPQNGWYNFKRKIGRVGMVERGKHNVGVVVETGKKKVDEFVENPGETIQAGAKAVIGIVNKMGDRIEAALPAQLEDAANGIQNATNDIQNGDFSVGVKKEAQNMKETISKKFSAFFRQRQNGKMGQKTNERRQHQIKLPKDTTSPVVPSYTQKSGELNENYQKQLRERKDVQPSESRKSGQQPSTERSTRKKLPWTSKAKPK